MSPSDTRTAILDLAEELVRSRSFNAFSYQDIANRIGIRKASIHYHFPTKEDLGVAMIERLRRQAVAWASAQVERNASPLERFDAYLAFQSDSLCRDGMICPQGILGAEFNALPERVRESYLEFLEQIQAWLTSLLRKGQEQGVFSDDASPEDQAALIQSATQGALQLSRASGREQRYHGVVRWLREHIVRQDSDGVEEENAAPLLASTAG